MKKIFYTLLTCVLLTTAGCQGLDETTYSSFQGKDFYTEKSHLEAACMSIYTFFANSGGWERNFHTMGTTQCKYTFSNIDVHFLTHTANETSSQFNSVWNTYYSAINLANDVIANGRRAISSNFPEEVVNQYIAEARFMRAFCYYHLTALWGDVPLRLTPTLSTNVPMPRTPVAEIMEVALEDLDFAIDNLPLQWTIKGRATKKSAIFLKGRVMLQMAGKPLYRTDLYEEIIKTMGPLVRSPGAYNAGLVPRIADVFSNTNKNSDEVLLAWSGITDPSWGSQLPFLLLPLEHPMFGASAPVTAGGNFGMAEELYHLFNNSDERRNFLISRYTQKNSGNVQTYSSTTGGYGARSQRGMGILKYTDPYSLTLSSAQNDKIVHRFSEAYLVFAEAYNEIGQPDSAAFYLNKVRVRANAALLPDSGNDYIAMKQEIRLERYLELFAEWSEIFDIRRLDEGAEHWREQQYILLYYNNDQVPAGPGAGSPIDQTNYDPKWDLFPIPSNEMWYNTQITVNNPGW